MKLRIYLPFLLFVPALWAALEGNFELAYFVVAIGMGWSARGIVEIWAREKEESQELQALRRDIKAVQEEWVKRQKELSTTRDWLKEELAAHEARKRS